MITSPAWKDKKYAVLGLARSGRATAEALLAAGADVNYRGSDGRTALDLARASNNRDIEMLLIQAGAELDRKSVV